MYVFERERERDILGSFSPFISCARVQISPNFGMINLPSFTFLFFNLCCRFELWILFFESWLFFSFSFFFLKNKILNIESWGKNLHITSGSHKGSRPHTWDLPWGPPHLWEPRAGVCKFCPDFVHAVLVVGIFWGKMGSL